MERGVRCVPLSQHRYFCRTKQRGDKMKIFVKRVPRLFLGKLGEPSDGFDELSPAEAQTSGCTV